MSRNRKRLVAAAIVGALAGAAAWRFVPGETPAGQPPLATLDAASLDALRADFNGHADAARVIILLSPT